MWYGESIIEDTMTQGETDIAILLSSLQPELCGPIYVFCTVPHGCRTESIGMQSIASIVEPEGLSVVLTQLDAQKAGLHYDHTFRKITLHVHSSLTAVGLTAAVSSCLARNGISANLIAGTYHDHVFVPSESAEQALELLCDLSKPGHERTEWVGF